MRGHLMFSVSILFKFVIFFLNVLIFFFQKLTKSAAEHVAKQAAQDTAIIESYGYH